MNINLNDEYEQFINELSQSKIPQKKFIVSLRQRLVDSYSKQSFFEQLSRLLKPKWAAAGISFVSLLIVFFIYQSPKKNQVAIKLPIQGVRQFLAKKDDWQYNNPRNNQESSFNRSSASKFQPNRTMGLDVAAPNVVSDPNLGFATGGAKDVNNFRENIKNGFLPLSSDITYEGLYYDYYFDTGKAETCLYLLCPSYSYAISKDPFTKNSEYYMNVGLNSGIKTNSFRRKKLNLVIVLDISGSMGAAFNRYYYDQKKPLFPEEDMLWVKKKMQVANESIVAMLNHLQPEDRFGIVLFDQQSYLAKPLGYVGETDMEAIKKHILELQEQGSTNHEAGYAQGRELYDDVARDDEPSYENRIIFLTDAMPNTGNVDKYSLLNMVKSASQSKIYTTFIGVGLDFNTELIEAISKVQGANYYSVHTASEFKNRLDKEFEYMVTPLAFDLSLQFNSDGWEIQKVLGSPQAEETTGELMKINTLFPSASTSEGVKGGIVLLKLRRTAGTNNTINLSITYKDREGKKVAESRRLNIPDTNQEYYANSGIRKAILLSRYASLIKQFIATYRSPVIYGDYFEDIDRTGIPVVDDQKLSKLERSSLNLVLNQREKSIFSFFKRYFTEEMRKIPDSALTQEVEMLDILSNE